MFCKGVDMLLIFETVVSTFANDGLEHNRSFDVRSKKIHSVSKHNNN